MRIIYAGIAQEVPDEYAVRLIEQGKASPDKTVPPAPKAKGKREDVKKHEPKRTD